MAGAGRAIIAALFYSCFLFAAPSEAGGIQMDMYIDGDDFLSLDLTTADPGLCRDACRAAPQCAAWTYWPPGQQDNNRVPGTAQCWLKSSGDSPVVRRVGYASGLVRVDGHIDQPVAASLPLPKDSALFNYNLVGGDYRSIDIAATQDMAISMEAGATACWRLCQAETECHGWTYVEPRRQAANRAPRTAQCWLKNGTATLTPMRFYACGTRDPSQGMCAEGGCGSGLCVAGECQCVHGSDGPHCNARTCDAVVCLNGGTCQAGECRCPPGFSGAVCDVGPCGDLTCLNGGTCVADECRCPPGFSGAACEMGERAGFPQWLIVLIAVLLAVVILTVGVGVAVCCRKRAKDDESHQIDLLAVTASEASLPPPPYPVYPQMTATNGAPPHKCTGPPPAGTARQGGWVDANRVPPMAPPEGLRLSEPLSPKEPNTTDSFPNHIGDEPSSDPECDFDPSSSSPDDV